MKIKEIYIYNIASLKGSNTIDFDEITNHSKTIAITGETGAGKSSILSSIAIALFGKNHKDNFSQTDLVTLGEEEAEVRLKFSVASTDYMSVWKCRVRKKNKELLKKPTVTRSLYIYDENQERELETTADEVIGLSFEQFTKTIILNQGEFSQFLLSNFSDRKKILESLLSDYDLTQLSVKSKRKLNTIEAKLDVINSKVDGLKENNLYNKDELNKEKDQVLKELKRAEIKKDIFKDYDSNIEDIIKDVKSFNNTKIQSKESESIISVKHSALNQAQIKLNELKIKDEDLAATTKSEITSLTKTKEKKAILELDIKQKNHLNELVSKNNSQRKVKDESYNKYKEEISKIQIQLQAYDNLPVILTEEVREIESNYKKIITLTSSKSNNAEKKMIILEALKSFYLQLSKENKQILDYSELTKEKIDVSILDNHIRDLKDLNTKKEELSFKAKNHQDEQQKLNKLNLQKSKIEEKIIELRKTINVKKEQVNLLAQANEAFNLNNKILDITQKSVESKECLICHSTDLSKVRNFKHETKDYSEELEKEQGKLNKVIRDLDFSSLKLTDLTDQINILQENQKENKDVTIVYTEICKKIQDQSEKIDLLKNQLIAYEQNLKDLTKVKDRAQQKKLEIQDLNKKIDEYELEEKNINALLLKKTDDIKLHLKDTPIEDLEKTISEIKLRIDLISRKNRGSEIIQNVLEDIKELDKSNIDLESRIDVIESKIQDTQKLIPKELFDKDIDQLIFACEQRIQKSVKNLNNAKDELNFINIETAQEKSKYKMLLEQLNAYESQFITKISSLTLTDNLLLSKIQEKLSKVQKIEDLDMKLLEESHSIIKEHRKIESDKFIALKENKSKLELLIEQAIKNERLVAESLKEVKLLLNEKSIAEQLYNILGKDEFRNHVLSLVEKNLIKSTNHQLNQLCQGRYVLKQQVNKSTASSDYYIIDKLNFSMTRKVSTLSGGETFMVSLAMAIALSELTRGENIIDNFFIDEGFGTLDEDSIEEVLEMLNSIKSQGKTITLISHIKSLTSRIPVNINVQKSESGSSKITTLYQ